MASSGANDLSFLATGADCALAQPAVNAVLDAAIEPTAPFLPHAPVVGPTEA
jgi:hypothetical protein